MIHVCPTCGQDVPGERVLVTLDSNTITYKDKSVRVSSKPADVASVLAAAMPRAVGYEHIIKGVYGHIDQPDTVMKCIQVWICRGGLRRDLKSLGLSIETVYGRSYRMLPTADSKGRSAGGKPTNDDIRAIRIYPGSCVEIAKIFNMSRQNVYNIRRRLSWRHVA